MAAFALTGLDARIAKGAAPAVDRPQRASFEEFLRKDARVPCGGGNHGPYSFEGREAILGIVRRIDAILGSDASAGTADSTTVCEDARPPGLPDALLGVAGGAQWGKTILELNLAAFLTSQRFLNAGLFLPDENLVEGVVDTKFRPDVLDQIPWFAEMTQVGKAVNKSGKTANRKGAFMVTDGIHRASGMVLGLQKIPTTYTFDVTLQDEVDDIPEKNAKFVKGRRTSSDLRFDVRIGTQRVHGRGQNKVWKDGSQGVVIFGPADFKGIDGEFTLPGDEVTSADEGWINPEENFPGIIRCQLGAAPSVDDPKLAWTGDFRRDGSDEIAAAHRPGNTYYLAHPDTGEELDRSHPLWLHRAPEKFEQRNFTYRAAQLGFAAIGLSQIVGQFQLAVNDPDEMIVFRCDVLALPQSLSQAITPAIVDRARGIDPYEARLRVEPGRVAFAGLDTGDKCWLWVNEIESPARRRLIYAASIHAGDMVKRAASLFAQLGLSALFIDQRPLVSQARELALELNGLSGVARWPEADPANWITLPGGLAWNPLKKRWTGLRCAVVRFDKKQIGAGIEHGLDVFDEGGMTKFVPLIRCNREETIDRAVRSYLTPTEGVNDVLAVGGVRELPAQLLPVKNGAIMETVEAHIITGSEREKKDDGSTGDYVDACPNHLLLANGYADLAENECGERNAAPAPILPVAGHRGGWRQADRSIHHNEGGVAI
jgi:hypothetical protein